MLDRWIRWTGTDAFFRATGAAAVAVAVWAAWPLAWSAVDLIVVPLVAAATWPLLVIFVVGPAGLAVSAVCALVDAAQRRPPA